MRPKLDCLETGIKNGFLAVTLQHHRHLGLVFGSHIIRMISEEGGIYTIVENLNPSNLKKWQHLLPVNGLELFSHLNEITETAIVKQFAKGKVNSTDFFESLSKDDKLSQYVRSFIERRMIRCYDIITRFRIPVYLKEKNFKNLYDDHKLFPVNGEAQPVFNFSVKEDESRYWISATCNGNSINLTNRNSEIICNEPCLIRINKEIFKFSGIDGRKISPFFLKPFIAIPKTAEKKYFETFVLNTIRNQLVNPEGFSITEDKPQKKVVLSLENRLAGGAGLILRFSYGSKVYLANSKPEPEVYLDIKDGKYHFTRFHRDINWEQQAILKLMEIGLYRLNEAEYYPSVLSVNDDEIQPYSLIGWVNDNTETVTGSGIEVVQNLGQVKYYLQDYRIEFNSSATDDWFDLYGEVVLEGFRIPFIHFKTNILKGIREFELPNGQIFILPTEWFSRYKPILFLGKESGNRIAIQKSLFNLLAECNVEVPTVSELHDRFSSSQSTITLPRSVNATLRDYQIKGIVWLNLLYSNKLGGCLADDMGLGKTLQTLTLLQSIKETTQKTIPGELPFFKEPATSILIVPTSLVHNWIREITNFTPELSYIAYTGSNRLRLVESISRHDLVITTYGILRNDVDLLKDYQFQYIILDESQMIKNPLSKTYRSVLLLKATHYLTLSGTPIENSLTDLWAQMNFINRGMLGTLKTFNEEFIQPIIKGNDEQQRALLKKLIEPFILRRTKEQVAKDLPELNEQVVYCDMTEEQSKVYEVERSSIRNAILEQVTTHGFTRSSIAIFRGLTRLRQVANHPLMIDDSSLAESGKYDEVTRSIDNVIAEGHKILIFSSFVKHLRLIEKYINSAGYSYEMLTGSTTNRKEVIDRFQQNPEIKLFLISIKAGGVGLNLTAADYIFILDPWWNPAVENQAVSRAHRIGQDKKTFVYRFISLGTVEEKIQRLQEKKEILAEMFVDSVNPLNLIGEERIMELLT